MPRSWACASVDLPDPETPTDLAAELVWLVLVNTEGQHSVWPAVRPVPAGWRETGPEGTAEECKAWIDCHWTDMCPVSQR